MEDGKIEGSVFVASWKSIPEANEIVQNLPINVGSVEAVKARLAAANMYLMAHKQVNDGFNDLLNEASSSIECLTQLDCCIES